CENCVVVEDAGKTYAVLCREFFARPDESLRLTAVTGTNGKTSVSTILHHILSKNQKRCGLIGTVENKLDTDREATLTTPDSFELYSFLRTLCENGFDYCVLEASSQGLCQHRLYGMKFESGIFTNLTEDHLDYHKTFENYKKAKLSLFPDCETAIINFDDPYAEEFIKAGSKRVITYSLKSDDADFTVKNIVCKDDSTSFVLVSNNLIHTFTLPVKGEIWVRNASEAIIAAFNMGVSLDGCALALRSFGGVKGRMETVNVPAPFEVIIDYAHTEDALRQVLLTLKRQCKGRLITVFGCGGDREKEKRSRMGKTVCSLSDIAVVTTDNPRNEDPLDIIDDILEGTRSSRIPVFIKPDRRQAIELALKKAKNGDIVLLAGKGHEDYQIIGNEKLPFDERDIVKDCLLKLYK
ncbi:MAG: UDP-N-acetylmuramoyl-L-alanyl-D-glutamate--2,6-diaminopimelate ligase, partial [Acutalibacteraceae bacterium]